MGMLVLQYWHFDICVHLWEWTNNVLAMHESEIHLQVLISFPPIMHLSYEVFIAQWLHLWPLQQSYPELWGITLQLIQIIFAGGGPGKSTEMKNLFCFVFETFIILMVLKIMFVIFQNSPKTLRMPVKLLWHIVLKKHWDYYVIQLLGLCD